MTNNTNTKCDIEDIKKWVDKEIYYYDECETCLDAVYDMLHDFKVHFLKISLNETFDNENDLIEYFKHKWKSLYKESLKILESNEN